MAGKYLPTNHLPTICMSRKRAFKILHFFNSYVHLQAWCKEESSSRSSLKNGSWQTKTQWVVVGVSYPRLIRFWYHFALVWEFNWKKLAKLILVKSIWRNRMTHSHCSNAEAASNLGCIFFPYPNLRIRTMCMICFHSVTNSKHQLFSEKNKDQTQSDSRLLTSV